MKLRLFTLLLAICMVFSMLPLTVSAAELVASGECGSGLTWELDDDGVLDIYGDGAIPDYTTHSKAPWYDYRANIFSVIFEEGITGIGKEAFAMCANVEEMLFAGDAPTIASNAFLNITATAYYHAYNETWTEDKMQNYGGTLTWEPFVYVVDSGTCGDDVVWELTEEGVLLISGTGAMEDFDINSTPWDEYRNDIIAVGIGDGVTSVGSYAFHYFDFLQRVVLADSVTSIGDSAFEICSRLTDIQLPDSLTSIGSYAFGQSGLTSIAIPDGVTSIEESTFAICESLETVTLPKNLTSIGKSAFYCCSHLWAIDFPEGLTSIGEGAFYKCSLLHDFTLPQSLTELGPYVFAECKELTSVTVPQGVTHINERTFEDCSNLVSVTLSDEVTSIDENAFRDCRKLRDFTMPSSVTRIGKTAFSYCTSLTSVTIPAKVTDIDECAFNCCSGLSEITFAGNAPTIAENAFWDVTTIAYYPGGVDSWTEDVMLDYGGTLTWKSYPHSHTPGEWTVIAEPTCTQTGEETAICSVCGKTVSRDIAALGHTVDDWTVTIEPNCTEKGEETGICTVCGETATRAVPANGHNFVDNECTVCGEIFTLVAPELLSIYSREQTSCKATWVPVEGADGYELWRTATPEDEESWVRIKTIKDGTQDRYTNKGLEVGTTYYYKVRAFIGEDEDARACTEFSEVKYMPAAVVFDGPYSNSTSRIRLRWNEIGGADGYQIWRLDDTGTWKIVKTLGDKGNTLTNDQGATIAYSNTGLEAGKQYTYKMRAFAIPEDGVKVFGAYSDAYTVAVKPETPKATVTSTKAGRAELSWNAVNGAAGYQIWMAESQNGEYKIVKSVTDGSTAYNKTGLSSGKTYYFKVRAYAEVDGRKCFSAFTDIKNVRVR